jgi:class 3 adenylate cyclase
VAICTNCGEENPDRFRLCGFCGTPLEGSLPTHEVRKTVSIVFSDLVGSTKLGEALDSEPLREVLTRYFEEMRAVLEAHGGRVEKYIGDAVMAVFGLPTLHEDDALRAARAAAAMQVALAQLNDELERGWGVRLTNRTGVNTGEVVAGDPVAGQRLVTGDAVNVAARLEQAAPPMQVLIGDSTFRLVRDYVDVEAVEPLELKGKSERVPAYRLVGVRETASVDGAAVRPLVGREQELGQLRLALADAVTSASPRLVTVAADAGVGKTRLIAELARAVAGDAQVLTGRCLAYGRGITFWPIRELLHQAAEIAPSDSAEVAIQKLAELADADVGDRLAGALGLSEQQYPVDEVSWAVRRLLERLAARHPIVFVVEDVHWAEQTLLDLLEQLVRSAQAPLLVVAATRPTLYEHRPTWGSFERADRIELAPLTREHSATVVANLLDGAGVDDELVVRIVDVAAGNPFYVEQLLAYVLEEGEAAFSSLPPTIHALLAARLDLLSAHERAVVECASVIGLVFHHAAVTELVPESVGSSLDRHLESLEEKRLIHRDRSSQEVASRFDHVLIRDAAYGALLKRARATLHERFAEWAEGVNRDRDRETEFEEILGYHFEQSHRYLGELGPLDEHGRDLGVRGAARLGSAGRRAFSRGDMPAAANLLRRASALLEETDRRRLELLPELGEALMETGEFAWAEVFLDEAVDGALALGDVRLEADAILTRLLVRHHAATDLDSWREEVDAETRRLIPILEDESADYELAKAWRMVGFFHGSVCRWEQVAAAEQRAVAHARKAQWHRLEARVSSAYTIALRDGPTPVAEAIARCEEIVEGGLIDRQAEALVLCSLSYLEAMRANFDRARALYAQARAMFVEVGATVLAAHTSLTSGRVELLAGDAAAAEAELLGDYEALGEMGERYFRPLVAALLAQALHAQGKLAEARSFADAARELAGEDDIEAQGVWRAVAARVRSADGEVEEAEALARESVELLRRTDAPVMQADVLLHLGLVLKERGQLDEARAVLGEAAALYRAKGVTPSDARVGELLDELPHSSAVA